MTGPDNYMTIFLQKITLAFAASLFLCSSFSTELSAATLSVAVAQQQVYQDDTFAVEWFIDTEGASINLIDAVLTYSPETLEVVELSTGSSAFILWAQQPRVVRPGVIALTGGVPAGIMGGRVAVVTTVFRALTPGTGNITLTTPSQVLLNDGQGTPVALTMTPVLFDILSARSVPTTIRSTTHPLESVWYKNPRVEITFDQVKGEEYSYSFSTNAELIPDDVPDSTELPIVYENMPDGVYHFTLARRSGTRAWQEARVFRVQIDTTSPEFMDARMETDENMFEGKPFATFAAVDKTSGIERYAIKSGWFGTYKNAVAPFELRRPLLGDTTYIRAIDKAGNSETTTINFPGYIRPWVAYVAILGVLLVWIVVQRRRHL